MPYQKLFLKFVIYFLRMISFCVLQYFLNILLSLSFLFCKDCQQFVFVFQFLLESKVLHFLPLLSHSSKLYKYVYLNYENLYLLIFLLQKYLKKIEIEL